MTEAIIVEGINKLQNKKIKRQNYSKGYKVSFAYRIPIALIIILAVAIVGCSGAATGFFGSGSAAIVHLDAGDDFNDLVQESPGRVLVDFYADWCGPCKTQDKVLQRVARRISDDRATIVKVNVDEHPQLAQQFRVSAIPTLVLFEDGEVIDRMTGVADQKQIISMLKL